MNKQTAIFLIAAASLSVAVGMLAGCQRGSDEAVLAREPGVYIDEDKHILIKDMNPDDVIVRVNGKAITKSDYLAWRRVSEISFRLKQKIPLGVKNKAARRAMKTMQEGFPMELLQREVMRQAVEAANVQPDEKFIKSAQSKFLKSIKKKKDEFDAVAALYGEDEALFRSIFIEDARFEALRRQSASEDYTEVDENLVSNHLARIQRFNENADRLNKKARAKAEKFRERVLAGGDFAELGKATAEVGPEFVEKWDTFQMGELGNFEDLQAWLRFAKDGDMSPPVDLDDGIAVVKLVAKRPVEDLPQGMEPFDEYELVRCTFRAYEYTKEETADSVRKEIVKLQRDTAQAQLGQKLFAAAVVEFPNGIDFFPEEKKLTQEEIDNYENYTKEIDSVIAGELPRGLRERAAQTNDVSESKQEISTQTQPEGTGE